MSAIVFGSLTTSVLSLTSEPLLITELKVKGGVTDIISGSSSRVTTCGQVFVFGCVP